MTIQAGDRIPDVKLTKVTADGPDQVDLLRRGIEMFLLASTAARTNQQRAAEITRSARDLRRRQHDHRIAGADQPAVHLAAHFLGDD